MTLAVTIEPHDTLAVTLRDGTAQATVRVRDSNAATLSLGRALTDSAETGYGECHWPSAEGGQYWWIFKRTDETLEVVVLWTRGGVAIWEHVFRATDAFSWICERFARELEGFPLPPGY